MPLKDLGQRETLRFFTMEQRNALTSMGVRQQYNQNKYLFYRGDPGDALYVVEKGSVLVSVKSADGREIILDILTDGDIVGEVAVLDGGVRMADALVTKNTTLVIIQKEDFLSFLKRDPFAYKSLIDLLCNRTRWGIHFLESTLFENTLKRIIAKLLALAKSTRKTPETLIEITQEDLSKMLGVSRETVNRNLQILQDKGLVFVQRGAILIPDIKKLDSVLEAN